MKNREKTLVRLHPEIYESVKSSAEKEGLGKTEMLERYVRLGMAFEEVMKVFKAA
jgi:hypothetical protein